ncbi:MAG: adenylate/guanylate cyclase domain-containing protein [Desulfobacula sp.]|nr:adenylate/guanylate cyclase domain-containing protein [Desulfobacula sp.]
MPDRLLARFNLPSFCLGCFLILLFCLIQYGFSSQKPALLGTIDNRIMDMMFNIRGPQPVSEDIIIVDIDEKSLKALGQWPWPRNILADLTNRIYLNQARAIGFDIVFAEQDRTSPAYYFKHLDTSVTRNLPMDILSEVLQNEQFDYDAVFGKALSIGPTVLGYAFQLKDDGLKTTAQTPFPSGTIGLKPEGQTFSNTSLIPAYRAIANYSTVAMAQSEGFINMGTDESGTTRQVPLFMTLDDIPYPSLALEVFRIGMGISHVTLHVSDRIKTPKALILGIQMNDRFIPTDGFGEIFLNYRGPAYSYTYISAVDVLKQSSFPILKNKFVLIGTSSTGLFDLKATPFSTAVPGIEIQANIIDNLLQSDSFEYDMFTEIGLNYTFIVVGGFLLSLILSFLGPVAGGISALVLFSAGITWNYYYFFLNCRHVGITYPILTWVILLLIISIFNAFREGKTKKFIQKAFSHYVAPDVVSQLLKNPKGLSLAGEEKELTVFFCDIRGFTSISEKMNSHDLGNFMNHYLSAMSRIIMENKGTVDKFIGDAIMAFWGAPHDEPGHALKAVSTALKLVNELKSLQDAYQKMNLPEISVGIGINTGIMSVGNFGSKERFDYTVMGDNVNLASRLEGANRNYGTSILISRATRDQIKDAVFCRYIDKVQVKGREEPVDLYEPLVEGHPPEELSKEVKLFENGISAYQTMDFEKADHIMALLNKNRPCLLYQSYMDRIYGFMKAPPPDSWNGIERRGQLIVNRLFTK